MAKNTAKGDRIEKSILEILQDKKTRSRAEIVAEAREIAEKDSSLSKDPRTIGDHLNRLIAAGAVAYTEESIKIKEETMRLSHISMAFIVLKGKTQDAEEPSSDNSSINKFINYLNQSKTNKIVILNIKVISGSKYDIIVELGSDDPLKISEFSSDYIKANNLLVKYCETHPVVKYINYENYIN